MGYVARAWIVSCLHARVATLMALGWYRRWDQLTAAQHEQFAEKFLGGEHEIRDAREVITDISDALMIDETVLRFVVESSADPLECALRQFRAEV